jgi:hypothetical protein
MCGISSLYIRLVVREALRDLLPAGKMLPEAASGTLLSRLRAALTDSKGSTVEVRVASAGDLAAFARDLLQAPEDVRVGILSGKIGLSLAPRGQVAAPAAPAPQRAAQQIAKGVLTEIMVAEIGKTSDRLIVGKGVVVTPLARDRAREMKLEIVRDRT